MKAVRVLEYGGQLVFDEVPTPTIAHDEILVKITNTAVNAQAGRELEDWLQAEHEVTHEPRRAG
jgi:NADPH:quinone reductase-like Zn-dependent oxidoreductase